MREIPASVNQTTRNESRTVFVTEELQRKAEGRLQKMIGGETYLSRLKGLILWCRDAYQKWIIANFGLCPFVNLNSAFMLRGKSVRRVAIKRDTSATFSTPWLTKLSYIVRLGGPSGRNSLSSDSQHVPGVLQQGVPDDDVLYQAGIYYTRLVFMHVSRLFQLWLDKRAGMDWQDGESLESEFWPLWRVQCDIKLTSCWCIKSGRRPLHFSLSKSYDIPELRLQS